MCGVLMEVGSSLPLSSFRAALGRLAHRGPDDVRVVAGEDARWKVGFQRLAIMDPTPAGAQPFADGAVVAACNGEIYNHQALRRSLAGSAAFRSGSDCEVLVPLYRERGALGLAQALDGEFAFVLVDGERGTVAAGRDPIGIRPLFWGRTVDGAVLFASEAKALHPVCREVTPFPPGCVWTDGRLVRFADPGSTSGPLLEGESPALEGIREQLVAAVRKRLEADVPVGALLSGGLDSSLVAAIATRCLGRPLPTFAVGLDEAPIDLPYARRVAEHLGCEHHEVRFTREEAIATVPEVVRQIESWDVTTVRASLGMYLVCRYVRRETPVRVLLTGEVSDELFGYKYTDFAPSAEAFQEEAAKRVRELWAYDVLRADRCIAAHGLEARVPFSDAGFVGHVMAIDPRLKRNTRGIGKWLLRQAFAGENWLPQEILWREKAAFSDAVGHGMVDALKAHAERLYSDADLAAAQATYTHAPPMSKEALWYRELFERAYPGRAEWIPDYWLPNRSWQHCNVADPSARVLPNYGASGH
jgi:asparagine synthase (glutamine-hydrolysing)